MFNPETKKYKAKTILALIGLYLLSIIIGCGGNSDENAPASPKEMKAFSLGTVSSPGEFVGTGTIEGKDVKVTVPYGTNVTALVATFTITGASVDIYLVEQTSGETPNDFSYPVVYTVIGDDGSKQNYTVTVTEAPSSAKEIKTFSLGTFAGTINEAEKTIAVIVPLGTNVTALIAAFTTTGESVTIGSTVQITGQTPNDFTLPVVYTVKAADASTTTYTVTVTFNQLATAVRVSMTPNTPAPHVGVFCTATSSITGSYTVTDPNGGSVITMDWYDEFGGVRTLRQTTTKTLASGETSGTDTLPGRFLYHHYITFTVTADGVVSNSVTNRIL
jgi:hypothetical protein